MPTPLRLHPHGEKLYQQWKLRADVKDVAAVEETLRRVAAGTWRGWRYSAPDRGDPKTTVIWPRQNLLVSVVFDTDEPEMFDVVYIGPDLDNWPD